MVEARSSQDGRRSDPRDPYVLGPGLLPTPFSAAEIRSASPAGRKIRMRIEVDGVLVGFRTNVFTSVDARGATVQSRRFDPDGRPIGEPEESRSTWRAFQRHAAFDAATTSRDLVRIATPLGTLECWHYSRREGGAISEFWFALGLAGMPIRYRSVTGDRVTSEVIVLENAHGKGP